MCCSTCRSYLKSVNTLFKDCQCKRCHMKTRPFNLSSIDYANLYVDRSRRLIFQYFLMAEIEVTTVPALPNSACRVCRPGPRITAFIDFHASSSMIFFLHRPTQFQQELRALSCVLTNPSEAEAYCIKSK